MIPPRDPAAEAARIAFLARETIEECTIRFHQERGLPVPDAAELAKIIDLGKDDERAAHQ